MKKIVVLAVLLTGIAAAMYAAKAQTGGGALVVGVCGTLSQVYVVGSTRSLTVNTIGQVCQ